MWRMWGMWGMWRMQGAAGAVTWLRMDRFSHIALTLSAYRAADKKPYRFTSNSAIG